MTTILLPVDGSPFSRLAFRAAGKLFSAATTKVILLHVAEPPQGVGGLPPRPLVTTGWPLGTQDAFAANADQPIFQSQVWEATRADVLDSMTDDARTLEEAGFDVPLEVRFGDPAQEIADRVEEGGVDCVVMATHGRSGLSRAVMGSVAERVLRMVRIPVVMVRGVDAERAAVERFA